jgi:hypothetical protein
MGRRLLTDVQAWVVKWIFLTPGFAIVGIIAAYYTNLTIPDLLTKYFFLIILGFSIDNACMLSKAGITFLTGKHAFKSRFHMKFVIIMTQVEALVYGLGMVWIIVSYIGGGKGLFYENGDINHEVIIAYAIAFAILYGIPAVVAVAAEYYWRKHHKKDRKKAPEKYGVYATSKGKEHSMYTVERRSGERKW